jgi:hypothetical protein
MTTKLKFDTAILNIQEDRGGLSKRYNVEDARRLLETLDRCRPIVGEALTDGTPTQEAMRGEINKRLLVLAAVVHAALNHPREVALQDDVVRRVSEVFGTE